MFSRFWQWKKMKIGQYFMKLRHAKQCVPVFLGHPVRPPRQCLSRGIRAMKTDCHSCWESCVVWRMHSCFSCLCSSQLFITLPLMSTTADNPIWKVRWANRPRFGSDEHYHDLPIDPEKVVDELAKKKRHLNFNKLTPISADEFSLCMPMIRG